MEGGNYIVSWCFGHLVELADASSYDERYAKWRYDDLPIVPESWMFEVTKDKAQQFKVLSALMKDKRVTELVCATDAGREGELIFRLVYNKAGCTKPFKRLWISSLEDSAIREGFNHLIVGAGVCQLHQMTEAPRNDVIAALHIAVLSGRCAQNLCDGLGNAGLFSND